MKKRISLGIVGLGIVSLVATAAPRQIVELSAQTTGVFPVSDIRLVLNNTVKELIDDELSAKCGARAKVTDLEVQVSVHHNEGPGTAQVSIEGEATCNPGADTASE
jgi:hypothetical protein